MPYSFLIIQQNTNAAVKTHRLMLQGASRFTGPVTGTDPTTPFVCPAAPTQSSPNTSLDFKKPSTTVATNGQSTIAALFAAQQTYISCYWQLDSNGSWIQATGGTPTWLPTFRGDGLGLSAPIGNPTANELKGVVAAAYRLTDSPEPDIEFATALLQLRAGAFKKQADEANKVTLSLTSSPFAGDYYTDGRFKIPPGQTMHLSGQVNQDMAGRFPHLALYGMFTSSPSWAFVFLSGDGPGI